MLGVLLMLRLGFWQLDRAAEKTALLEAFGAGDTQPLSVKDSDALADLPRYRRVRIGGRILERPWLLLENRFLEDRPGFDLLLLLQPEQGPLLVLNQGWVAQPPDRSAMERWISSAQWQEVTGRVDRFPRPGVVLGTPFQGQPLDTPVWRSPYMDAESLQQRLAQQVASVLLLMDQPLYPDARPHWSPATMPPEKHRGYALQWFSMAAVLAAIGLWLAYRTRRA